MSPYKHIDTQQAVSKQPERVYVVNPYLGLTALSDGHQLDYVRQWQPNPTSWTAF